MPLPNLKSPEDLERFLDENEGLDVNQLVPLPYPYQDWEDEPIPALTEEQRSRYEVGPDGVCATLTPVPQSDEEREKKVAGFLEGLAKLLTKEVLPDLHRGGAAGAIPPHLPCRGAAEDHQPLYQARREDLPEAARQ